MRIAGTRSWPADVTLGAVWTYRTDRPFTASAGVDLDGNRNNDYVPGTKKGDGNRMDMTQFLQLVNDFRATRRLAPIPESQIESDDYSRVDLRVSKAFDVGVSRVEVIGQVFNAFGTVNLGGIGVTRQTSALSNAFGRILGAQPLQQGEIAMRVTW